jgi:diguanylate cyclase (GGDEF)-like protein
MLTAIPILGLGILALREVNGNISTADAARDVARTVEEQSAAINVFTPLQIERISAVGVARLLELGLDPIDVVAAIEEDYLAVSAQNTPVLDAQIAEFARVVDRHDFGDRTDLTQQVATAITRIETVRSGLVDGTVTVEQAQDAYDSMLAAADLFLTEAAVAFQIEYPDVFDAQDALREQELNRIVIRTASLETSLVTDVITGTSNLDIIALIAAQTVHDEALTRVDEQRTSESVDALVDDRNELQQLSTLWSENDPVTPERVSIQPALYGDFAALFVDRLEYLEAVEAVTIESGAEVVAEAAAEAERINATNRRTALGLLAIGIGVLVFEIAIIRSFARPLGRLRRNVERIGGGDLAVDTLPLAGPSDIRRVTGALNDMAGTLDSVDRQLKRLATGAATDVHETEPIPGEVGTSIRESVDRLFMLTNELRASEERLQVEARHDALTSRLNRVGALDYLEKQLVHRTQPFPVMIVDLDGFKNVNDTNGQAIGDQMLCEVADRLAELVGDDGVVARIGGDEFMVVDLEHHDEASAVEFGRRMIEVIERPFHFGDFVLFISGSVGARMADASNDALGIVERADAAVYHAKRRGRGRVEMYDVALQDTIERSAEIELALRRGIEAGELILHLQPTADVATGRAAGAEALVRWDRPEFGIVMPGDFIPIAERSGLVIEIGRWVLREACALVVDWKRRDPDFGGRLAINVSGRHVVEADLVSDVDAAIAATGADPRLLELELTESHLLDDIGRVRAVLAAVRQRGVSIAVDDFGTGYSSMTYLQRLPLDSVKIDRSFVERATDGAFDAVVIESIVRLGGALGLEIVAEGIETDEQLAWLRNRGVHRAQGYLIAPPMPVDRAERAIFSGPLLDGY